MACIGAAQTGVTDDPASLRLVRRIGIGSALTLGTIDVLCAPKGRISKMYLVDALAEAGWLALWATTALNARK